MRRAGRKASGAGLQEKQFVCVQKKAARLPFLQLAFRERLEERVGDLLGIATGRSFLRRLERYQPGLRFAGLRYDDLLSVVRPFEQRAELRFGFVDVYDHDV